MKEHVCQFGPDLNLVGILTEPDEEDLRRNAPALVILNAGLLHRVGPNRMSVELARRLAACGIRSMRFDLSGCGDSESPSGADPDENRSLLDIKDALDFLELKHDTHNFVLIGLCSGADHSHAVALRDPRVVGSILLDGHGYWTSRSYVEHYLPRFFLMQVWINLARRTLSSSKRMSGKRAPLNQQFRRPFGPRLEVKRELQSLVDRGMQMLYLYSGGVENYYNYPGQFFDMFKGLDARGRIEVEYSPNVDHTYTFVEDRERMYARIIDWYTSRTWNAHL
jgi:pimeloyl-ACP methyl ester carboxylesterase